MIIPEPQYLKLKTLTIFCSMSQLSFFMVVVGYNKYLGCSMPLKVLRNAVIRSNLNWRVRVLIFNYFNSFRSFAVFKANKIHSCGQMFQMNGFVGVDYHLGVDNRTGNINYL